MSSDIEQKSACFEKSYPEAFSATLSWSLQFGAGVSPGSKLQLPDFYLRPGEAVLLFLGADGRVTVKAFGEKNV